MNTRRYYKKRQSYYSQEKWIVYCKTIDKLKQPNSLEKTLLLQKALDTLQQDAYIQQRLSLNIVEDSEDKDDDIPLGKLIQHKTTTPTHHYYYYNPFPMYYPYNSCLTY